MRRYKITGRLVLAIAVLIVLASLLFALYRSS
ncbi:hypothetical protein BH24GEM3_BH24GEM3_15630 [soil metagenome]|jgi:hypothetical protein